MAKRELSVLVVLEAAVLLIFSCSTVEATNGTIPTTFGCVFVGPSNVTCNGVPAIVTLPLANMGLQQVPIFEGVYEDVRTIDLGNNLITRILGASFTSAHFPSLVEIILMGNCISRVEIDAFQVSSLQTLDLRNNQLQEFTVGSFTQFTGPSFSLLHLEGNQIQSVSGTSRGRFTREFFPVLTIHLSGNALPCEAEFFIRLCPFLEDDGTMCSEATTEGTELLTIQRDVCMDLSMPDDESDSNPKTGIIIGGAVGGVLGILLVILVLVLLVVCLKLKMWEKKFDDIVQSQPKPQQLIQPPVPPTRPFGYTDPPKQQSRVGPDVGEQETIYEDIDFPSQSLPEVPVEELYYDSNGYILRIDSVPLQPHMQDKQVSVLQEGTPEGTTPQAYETPVSTQRIQRNDNKDKEGASEEAEKKGPVESPSNDEKKDSVYLQMVV